AVGWLGLLATTGVVVYELRNTQIYDYALHRAKQLELRLELESVFSPGEFGGLFSERPVDGVRALGLSVKHDRGLALVYGAAIGGWVYVASWGLLHALGVASSQKVGGVIGAIAGVVVIVEFLRIDSRPNKAGAPRPSQPEEQRSAA